MSLRLRAVSLLPLALSAVSLAACSTDESVSPVSFAVADRKLVVLFTSDEHSHVFSFSPELDDYPAATTAGTGALVGGVARRATLIASQRAAAKTAGEDSVLVSAGDNQMGALPHVAFESASVDWGTMKALGYDVTTFGNHEFDFGPKALAASITAAQAGAGLPPIVSSNIHFSDTSPDDDDLAKFYSTTVGDSAPVHPYRVVTTASGLKVGFLGLVGVNAAHVAPNKTPVQFSAVGVDPTLEGDLPTVLPLVYADLQPVVDTLRNTEKVDLVVALSHAGENDTSTDAATQAGEDYLIAANVKGIDLIVSGHAHNSDPKPIVVKNTKGGNDTLVLNGGSYGRQLGRVEYTIHGDGSAPAWNTTTQALLSIDDTTVPDPTRAATLDGLVKQIEAADDNDGKPYLEKLLTNVEGSPVTDDASKVGDLYFKPIGKTAFDVTNVDSLLALSGDAMLAQADVQGVKADFGLESAGVIRNTLAKGKTGAISAADAFSVVPLGTSPVDQTIGYPLVLATLNLLELRAVFEFGFTLGATNQDYHLVPAGMKVEYDKTRPPVTNKGQLLIGTYGWVMKISVDSDHSDGFEQFDKVIYDRVAGIGTNTDLFTGITSSYIAQFAADVGVTLKDNTGKAATLADLIVHRTDGSEVKEVEAFFGYLKASPGGTLASTYDATSALATNRFVCIKGC